MILKVAILLVVAALFVASSDSICSKHCTEPPSPNDPSVPTGNSWYFDKSSEKCLSIKGMYFEKGGNRFLNKEICEITCWGCKSGYNLRQEPHAGNCLSVTTTHDRDFSEDNCASDEDCEDSAQKCCPDGGRFKSCLNAVNQIMTNMIYKEPAPRRNWDNEWRNGFHYPKDQRVNHGQIKSSGRYNGINAGRLQQFFTEDDYVESVGVHINSDEDPVLKWG